MQRCGCSRHFDIPLVQETETVDEDESAQKFANRHRDQKRFNDHDERVDNYRSVEREHKECYGRERGSMQGFGIFRECFQKCDICLYGH